jgi:hypothetical protein
MTDPPVRTCASDLGGRLCGLPVYPCPYGPLPDGHPLKQAPLAQCEGWLHRGSFHHCLWPAAGYEFGRVAQPAALTAAEQ